MVRVLFVCMGNICRSPTAEGVMRHRLNERGLDTFVDVDSAGTIAYHAGKKPDRRAREEASRQGVDLGAQRARQVTVQDFETFHFVLAMDRDNLRDLEHIKPSDSEADLRLLCDFAPELPLDEVPDPYYGGDMGFRNVFRIVDTAIEKLIDHIESDLMQQDEPPNT